MRLVSAAALSLVLVLSCPAWAQRSDRNVDQPVVRSLNWFGYVGGDDIRANCQPGARSQIRVIYNGLWEEQVRAYDIFLQPDGTAGLTIGVLADQGNLAQLLLSSPSDITSPWRLKKGQRLLSVAETQDLMGALQASDAFGPPRDGLRLPG